MSGLLNALEVQLAPCHLSPLPQPQPAACPWLMVYEREAGMCGTLGRRGVLWQPCPCQPELEGSTQQVPGLRGEVM